MRGQGRVTLVVACYNHARYVRECLASVASQTMKDFDLIVTDDASTDDSREAILGGLASLGLEAKLIFHEANRGLCTTFNEALALVETPFVAFLSADDWMAAERLEAQACALSEADPDVALAYSNLIGVTADGTEVGELPSGHMPASRSDLFPRLLRHNWIAAPSVMTRVSALRAVGGFDPDLAYEDHDMWLRLSRHYDFLHIDKALVYYRTSPESLGRALGGTRSRDYALSRARMLTKHLGYSAETDDFIRTQVYRHAVFAYRHGAPPRAVMGHLLRGALASRSLRGLAYGALAALGVPGWVIP